MHAQNIYTIAGNGTNGFSGDSGVATLAAMRTPFSTVIDTYGNIYIADYNDQRVRKVNSSGIITTIAGTGTGGYNGDSIRGDSAQLLFPAGLAVDANNNLYIADQGNDLIRKIDASGMITTIAGMPGGSGFNGNGILALNAVLNGPSDIKFDASGNLYIADLHNYRVRKIDTTGHIYTIAGNGSWGFSGDGAAATSARLKYPYSLGIDNIGNVYISDCQNYRIRKVDAAGIITTVVGTGVSGFSGDGAAAYLAKIGDYTCLTTDASNNLIISDRYNKRIRWVNSAGIIFTLAGTGNYGYTGDGGPALLATFASQTGISFDQYGDLYVADFMNYCVRKICFSSCSVNLNEAIENDTDFTIFPNPSEEEVTIKFKEGSDNKMVLKIYDCKGECVHSSSLSNNESFNLNLNAGIYNVIVHSDTRTFTKRLVIQ